MPGTVLNSLICINVISFSFNPLSNPGVKSCYYHYFTEDANERWVEKKNFPKVTQSHTVAELGHSEPRGRPPSHCVIRHVEKSPRPQSYSPDQDHLCQPWKGAFGLQGEDACSVVPYSSKDPTKSGSFMAKRDLKDNLLLFPVPFYHEVTEVQKIKNSLSKIKNFHVQM